MDQSSRSDGDTTQLPAKVELEDLSAAGLFSKLISAPLYDPIELKWRTSNAQLRAVRAYNQGWDMYCPDCGERSTFWAVVSADVEQRLKAERLEGAISAAEGVGRVALQAGRTTTHWTDDFALQASCSRRGHAAVYHFKIKAPAMQGLKIEDAPPVEVVKIGQSPSLTDFQIGDLSRFEEGMTSAQRKEFVRGINSTAHGFSVAACVYFRRAFESVLMDARREFMQANQFEAWPDFDKARIDERIRLLRGYLPEFMTDHPQLYSILSLGVHELTEKECAKELPMLREAIELIMEDRVTEARKKKQREQVSKLIAQRVNHHQGRRSPGEDGDANGE